jgi:hypothetical protein
MLTTTLPEISEPIAIDRTQFKVTSPVWQQAEIGFTVAHQIFDPIEALILAGANWGVYKEKLGSQLKNVQTEEDYYFTDTRLFGVYRDTDNQFLGAIGKDFQLLQNHEGFNWFKPFLENQQAYIESAGTLRNGEVVWIIARLTESSQQKVVAGDFVEQRILLTLCHNTNRSPQATLLNSRMNGQVVLSRSLDSRQVQNLMKMRQTRSLETQMARVNEKIQLARAEFDRDVAAYQALASKYMTLPDMRQMLRTLFDTQLTAQKEKNGFLVNRYADLSDYKPAKLILANLELDELIIPYVRSTAWALYLAIAHYQTYQAKDTRRGCDRTKWEAQLEQLWFVNKNNLLDRAMHLLLAPTVSALPIIPSI